ncbi:GNAT family N-acetyltransferase [Methanobacterium subterraneum]|uniref:GNAT family N-acetyltransferase n=1 Tax=Methanobacterium subterraneum TaxID=59277 RepID=A0A2H4VBE7_9EURY|nr:GNAT family N-acetyltransferase [Methanobacterium subterraneum]AUB55425.1 GNAT family N-acetyltransferase [Methanobacterium subterraneum]NMO09332.1 GNAT family N-acetyltransferase [Methanobacterium subterraneum]PKL71823.1 MAG: N-acetyltransferase [Methanobacteriales archaeon HGW-Methanobacteriales-2]
MSIVKFIETNQLNLDLIQPLWEKLNEHHRRQKSDFKDHYANFTFQERKKVLLNKARDGDMLICLAEDERSGIFVGYSVTTISSENVGEIDSIYVGGEYRLQGIGNELMKRSLGWMDKKGVNSRKVVVATSNQEAISFYERYGFRRRSINLEKPLDHLKW